MLAGRQLENRQAAKLAAIQTVRQPIGIQPNKQAAKEVGSQTGRQSKRQAAKQAGSQRGRQPKR